MRKRLFALVLVVVLVMAITPAAYAEPTNYNYWYQCFVYGGNSQQICTLGCTDIVQYKVTFNAISLNGESKISFRPYGTEGKLCSTTLDMNTITTTYKSYDRGTRYIGKMITMKASIPNSSSAVYATFRGTVYI